VKRILRQRKPLAAYLRLSVDRDGRKIGYDVQRAAIQAWAQRNGHTIGKWYQDKDLTAADRKVQRPEYEQMLTDVDAGTWGGIVVWKLDRLVRLAYEFERCLRMLEDARGVLFTVEPDISTDPDNFVGPIMMRILIMVAEMEIANMKARARGHRLERAERGMFNGGGPRPFGFVGAIKDDEDRYVNVGEAGVRHDEAEAGLLREAARRIAWEGGGWTDVLKEWAGRSEPVVGTTGKPMAVTTLRTILTSNRIIGLREYAVENPDTGEILQLTSKAVWEPIINKPTWDRLRSLARRRAPTGPKSTYLLSGHARCGTCDMPLGGRHRYIKDRDEHVWSYICKKTTQDTNEGGHCGKLDIRQGPVDDIIRATVLELFSATPRIVQELQAIPAELDAELDIAYATIEETEHLMMDLARRVALPRGHRDRIGAKEWDQMREPLAEQLEEAELTVRRLSSRRRVPSPSKTDLDQLEGWYDGLELAQRQAVVQLLIPEVIINPGHSGPRFNPRRVVLRTARSEKP
jgi:DNA invertase Pin-like site-specific DNA recombinase